MAISIVQTATGTGNPPCTFGSPITPGNTVVLIAPCYNTSGSTNTITAVKIGTTTVTGTFACFNNGGTGTVNSGSSGGNVASLAVWVIPNIGVSGQTTVDYTPSGSQVGQVAYEVAGLGTSPTLDQSASGNGITTGTVTTGSTGAITGSPELIVGGAMIFAGATGAPSGFTTANPTGDCWAGYQIATSSGGTYTWTQTGNGHPWAVALATILGTPAPPPAVYTLIAAPYRPPPPPLRVPPQVITGLAPPPPAGLAGILQAATPYETPRQVTPQVVTAAAVPAVTVNAVLASGTGTAEGPVPAIAVNAAPASGAATAQNATASTSASGTANAAVATGTGTAQSPVAAIGVNAGLATGAGAALNATASTSSSGSASAVLATAAGAAQQPVPAIGVNAAVATGTGAAQSIGRAATAGLASGTGTAQNATAVLAAQAQAQAAHALAAALNASGAGVEPFTVGTLTASDAPGGTGGILTASDQRTGGPS